MLPTTVVVSHAVVDFIPSSPENGPEARCSRRGHHFIARRGERFTGIGVGDAEFGDEHRRHRFIDDDLERLGVAVGQRQRFGLRPLACGTQLIGFVAEDAFPWGTADRCLQCPRARG